MSSYRLPDGTIPVLLSADTPDLLRSEAAAILTYITDRPDVLPWRVAETLFRTRVPRRHRALSMVNGREELSDALRSIAAGGAHSAVVRTTAPAAAHRLAYVFPGQGGQRPGMGRLFYESAPAFRAEADRCDQMFQELFGESPMKYLLDDRTPTDDSARVVQPALFTQMAGLAALWQSVGIAPDVTIGHSQGEIAAAYVSGKMTLADAVLIVGTRAHAVDTIASDDYAMAVVAADRDEAEELLACRSGWAELSVVNSPNMVGLSGERGTVQEVVDTLTERGRFARTIRIGYPAHTLLLNGFRDDMREMVTSRLGHPYFLETDIECVGATLGRAITADLPVAEYWFWNLRNTVRFDKAIAAAVARDVDTFIEVAEHPTLQLAVQENLGVFTDEDTTRVTGTSSRTAADLREFTRNLAVLAVHDLGYPWELLCEESDGVVRPPLPDFPNVRMNEVRLWLPYNEPSARQVESVTDQTTADPSTDTRLPQLLVEEWVRLVQRSLVQPRIIGIIDHTRGCVELSAALCAAAETYGATAHLIDAEIDGAIADFDTIVVLLPKSERLDSRAAVTEVAEFFGNRSWWPGMTGAVAEYWLVTVGGEAVATDDAPPHLVHAAASAGFRCIGAEHPGVAYRHLDIPSEHAGPDAATAIIQALHTADESELALRGDTLYAKRLTEVDRTTTHQDLGTPEHIVIIGGTGKIGLEFAEHFAHQGTRRITLVSRSGETAAVAERLRRIRPATAAEIGVVSCDVTDNDAVSRLANDLRDAPANLIIHAAVDYSDIELAHITTEQVYQALRTKVIGISNVLDSLARTEDCRAILCSSLAATLGGRGQIIYAAANRLLDALALQLRTDGLDCVSVQWGQWTVHLELGASGTAKLAGAGAVPMRPADAISLGTRGFRENVIVAAFDWPRAYAVLGAFGYGTLLSQLVPLVGDEDPAPVAEVNLSARMVTLVAEVIGVDQVDMIDTTLPMVTIGLDSLQALELRRRVKTEFQRDLPVAELLAGASVDDIVTLFDTPPPVPAVHTTERAPENIAERARLAAERAVPDDMDADRIRSARGDLDVFGMRAMWQVLDPALGDGAVHTVDEIATRLEFAPRHRWLLRRWLGELTTHGCLEVDPDRGYRIVRPVPAPIRPDRYAVCADLGYSREFATFLASADDRLIELAQDRVRVQELLFPDGDMLTAEAAYRDNVISRYLNLAAREVVADIVTRLASDRTPVRILELGAGIGGTTDDVAAGLSGLSVDYHFTDLSTFFLTAARKRFTHYPWMRYGILDLNTDLGQQPRYDIVIAANVLHNAQHIGEALHQLHDLLNPGGAIVYIEACRAHCELLTSVKFLMSPGPGRPHPGATDVRAGTDRIFLTESEWLDQLTTSGLTPMLVLPDPDHPLRPLDQRVFAAIRE